jgi:hypothetical protein
VDLTALREETKHAYKTLAGNTAGKRLTGRLTRQHIGENRHKMVALFKWLASVLVVEIY